ncbi:TPA-induced transmembrane protein homolog [Pagrus major]|uniref:TPA-induced transmembrane protein homolog n=1 Tax=Pagrus major TaxID=143350 RepID=UPI003CC83B17
MDIPLVPIPSDGRVKAGNGDSVVCEIPDEAAETDVLLAGQTNGCNGETVPSNHAAENQRNQETPQESFVCRIKRELNEVVLESKSSKCKIRLWMIILFIISLITTVIIISLAVCSAMHEDPDENFDPLLFKVPVYFNGSFQLPNLVFTDELLTLSSNESQTLATGFQEKLADLYRSSPALGRYFSEAEINAFRNGSVMADYQLKFLMPEEGQDQLRNFTLSREMVYNVFRQFLYDQEPNESEPMYIDPVSLKMFVRHY